MNQDQAQKFIKEHLDKKGNKPVVITAQLVRRWWHILNEGVFYGSLKQPAAVDIKKLTSSWARCREAPGKNQVSISMANDMKDKKFFVTILVHEMVHAWEYYNFGCMTHGPTFKGWKGRVKEITGLELDTQV